jgi:hypothetical protein
MRFVPVYIAVDTDDNDEALACARTVVESTEGESFDLRMAADAQVHDAERVVMGITELLG